MSIVVSGLGVVCSIAQGTDRLAAALRRGDPGIVRDPWTSEGPPLGAPVRGFSLEGALEARSSLPPAIRDAATTALRRAPCAVQMSAAAALEAWEHAGLHRSPVPRDRRAVVVAGNNLTGGYAERQRPTFERNPSYLSGRVALHIQDTDHVGTISEILDIGGEGFTVGGASASGNMALIQASRVLELEAADVCLVVGVTPDLSPVELQAYTNLGAMVVRFPEDRARPLGPPFDASRRGFVLGEGSAAVVLESSASVRRRAGRPLATLAGYATELDGSRLAHPSEHGEASVMRRALGRAGLEPRELDYINPHGSGSTRGDQTELAALRLALGDCFSRPWVNATKALTGHCLGAAGVLEAVATVVQIQGGFVHPTPGLDQPIDAECRFVGARSVSTTIRFALSNAFGFGGINTSILLADPHAQHA